MKFPTDLVLAHSLSLAYRSLLPFRQPARMQFSYALLSFCFVLFFGWFLLLHKDNRPAAAEGRDG